MLGISDSEFVERERYVKEFKDLIESGIAVRLLELRTESNLKMPWTIKF